MGPESSAHRPRTQLTQNTRSPDDRDQQDLLDGERWGHHSKHLDKAFSRPREKGPDPGRERVPEPYPLPFLRTFTKQHVSVNEFYKLPLKILRSRVKRKAEKGGDRLNKVNIRIKAQT